MHTGSEAAGPGHFDHSIAAEVGVLADMVALEGFQLAADMAVA